MIAPGTVVGGAPQTWATIAPKTVVQITKHAAERMAERGITQKMVEIAILKGTKYLDPKNGTYNYVLKTDFLQEKIC